MALFVFFFFKQKTAYEMRISDWSSDVCSSDLGACVNVVAYLEHGESGFDANDAIASLDIEAAVRRHFGRRHPLDDPFRHVFPGGAHPDVLGSVHRTAPVCSTRIASIAINVALDRRRSRKENSKTSLMRSEEHTSELQSLMRITY